MVEISKRVDIFVRFRSNVGQFKNIMKLPQKDFARIHDASGKLNRNLSKNQTAMGRFGFGLRRATHGMRGFRMEMLGVMFFGMMIQKTFMSLLQPALQMSGAMELLSTVLGIMFLPVGLAVIDFAIWLMEKWDGLSEKTKGMIRGFVVAGVVFGAVMMVVGQFALGIGSLILAFGGLLGPIGLVVAGLAAFWLWKEKNEAIKESLSGLLSKFDELWEYFLDLEAVRNFLKSLGMSDEQIEKLKDPVKAIKGAWVAFKKWIVDKFEGSETWQNIVKKWETIKDAAYGFYQDWYWNYWPKINDSLGTFYNIAWAIGQVIKGWSWLLSGQASSDMGTAAPGLTKSFQPGVGLNIPGLDDFVISGGQVYKTNPNDTIVGSLNGAGMGTNVTINIGTMMAATPEEVSDAVVEGLDRSMRTR